MEYTIYSGSVSRAPGEKRTTHPNTWQLYQNGTFCKLQMGEDSVSDLAASTLESSYRHGGSDVLVDITEEHMQAVVSHSPSREYGSLYYKTDITCEDIAADMLLGKMPIANFRTYKKPQHSKSGAWIALKPIRFRSSEGGWSLNSQHKCTDLAIIPGKGNRSNLARSYYVWINWADWYWEDTIRQARGDESAWKEILLYQNPYSELLQAHKIWLLQNILELPYGSSKIWEKSDDKICMSFRKKYVTWATPRHGGIRLQNR